MTRDEITCAMRDLNGQYEMWCHEEAIARSEMYEAESQCEAIEERIEALQEALDALGCEE